MYFNFNERINIKKSEERLIMNSDNLDWWTTCSVKSVTLCVCAERERETMRECLSVQWTVANWKSFINNSLELIGQFRQDHWKNPIEQFKRRTIYQTCQFNLKVFLCVYRIAFILTAFSHFIDYLPKGNGSEHTHTHSLLVFNSIISYQIFLFFCAIFYCSFA